MAQGNVVGVGVIQKQPVVAVLAAVGLPKPAMQDRTRERTEKPHIASGYNGSVFYAEHRNIEVDVVVVSLLVIHP